MSFTETEISELENMLDDAANIPQAVAQFHSRFPGKSVTRCDASDMGAENPYRTFNGFGLYFVDGRDHCWQITGNPNVATGIVIAKRSNAL
jgi:hypothetical protein